MTNELLFAEDKKNEEKIKENTKWKILIVDDEEEIHSVTKMVLANFEYEKRGIELISAYSAEEAKIKLKEIDGIVLILLDVVMETENSGLELIKYIREELKNNIIRIILRTGQPGQAPEREVIKKYDINDYKEKTELTAKKMYTLVITALRSYQNIDRIKEDKRELEKIINSLDRLFSIHTVKELSEMILTQIIAMLKIKEGVLYLEIEDKKVVTENIIGIGKYSNYKKEDIKKEKLNMEISGEEEVFKENLYIKRFKTQKGLKILIYLEGIGKVSELDQYLIKVFLSNVPICIDNIFLLKEGKKREKELIKANKVKEEFLANVTHELRTPLTGILGIMDILGEMNLTSEQNNFLKLAKISSLRLGNIINTIIKFTTLFAEKKIKEEFNIEEKLETLIKEYEYECKKKSLKFRVIIDEKLDKKMIGDINNILEIINKLVENALKFTEKGEINLEIIKKNEKKGKITLQISIKDTGIGIKEDKKNKVFNNFFQGEYYMTKKYSGIGMGLALVRKIVEKLEGEIGFISEEGKGSTFLVELPLEIEK